MTSRFWDFVTTFMRILKMYLHSYVLFLFCLYYSVYYSAIIIPLFQICLLHSVMYSIICLNLLQ